MKPEIEKKALRAMRDNLTWQFDAYLIGPRADFVVPPGGPPQSTGRTELRAQLYKWLHRYLYDSALGAALSVAIRTAKEEEDKTAKEPEIEREKVVFTKNWKVYHPGWLYPNGRLYAACSCPGSSNGHLARGANILHTYDYMDYWRDDLWDEANCGMHHTQERKTWGERRGKKKAPA